MAQLYRDSKGRFLKGVQSSRRKGEDVACLVCGKKFHVKPFSIKRGKGKYCSWICRNKGFLGRRRGIITEFKKGQKPWTTGKHRNLETKQKQSIKMKGRFLGDKSPSWKGGISNLNRYLRTTREYYEWRKLVFERDNYTCQICGIRGGEIEADHIKQFAYYPELRFVVSNGRTLCEECHKTTETWGRNLKYA